MLTEVKLALPPFPLSPALIWLSRLWVGVLALFIQDFLLGFQLEGRETIFGVQRRGQINLFSTEPH